MIVLLSNVCFKKAWQELSLVGGRGELWFLPPPAHRPRQGQSPNQFWGPSQEPTGRSERRQPRHRNRGGPERDAPHQTQHPAAPPLTEGRQPEETEANAAQSHIHLRIWGALAVRRCVPTGRGAIG